MKICFVGPANSAHIVKWCKWFANKGHDVHVVSYVKAEIPNTKVHLVDIDVNPQGSDIEKLKYLLSGNKIKKHINNIKPDVVNVHYATSYGVATALSGIKNYVLSVWGSDIYDFPKKSFFHKLLLKYSLKKATYLFSTSKAMADEASKYTKRKFKITPFGVDMELFNPNKKTKKDVNSSFVVGTVKTLADLYGIDYILKAVAIIKNQHQSIGIALRIAGDGPQAQEYINLAKNLGIEKITTFLGRISQEQAAIEWANMDVAVIPSVSYESFGVAAVEAQASGTPVIISDVAGLLETTYPEKSSMVVPKKDANAIADCILKLYNNPSLCNTMGNYGKEYVLENYEINKCFENIENFFLEKF